MAKAHRFHPTVLRAYDVRGVVGETLVEADAEALGRAFGTILRRRTGDGSVCVGLDGRLSSPALEAALIRGLAGTGARVLRVGRGPTPMLYYAVYALEAEAGVMVTGSHNPPDFNGFKLVLGGKPFYGEDIQELGRIAAAGEAETGAGVVEERPVIEGYVDRLVEAFRGERPLTVAWDAANGAAGEVMAGVTARLPGRHILLNERIDGTFPAHHPDPTIAKYLEELIAAVRAERCDLGVAFDGDGDRIGVVDEKGRLLWGDQLLAIFAADVLRRRPGATVVFDVKASQVLFDEVARLGGKPLMWRTGHSLIKAKMAEEGSPLGGEVSGHIFFADRYYGFDDALYAAVRLLAILAESGEQLGALRDRLPAAANTPEIRFACTDERKFEVVAEIRDGLEATGADVIDIDGVRVKTADGWWLLRPSNTQPVLVARCEAADEESLARVKADLRARLRASGLTPPEF